MLIYQMMKMQLKLTQDSLGLYLLKFSKIFVYLWNSIWFQIYDFDPYLIFLLKNLKIFQIMFQIAKIYKWKSLLDMAVFVWVVSNTKNLRKLNINEKDALKTYLINIFIEKLSENEISLA
jgi:hypothetical protein